MDTDIDTVVTKLNKECNYKDKQFRVKWSVSDIDSDITSEERSHRTYCYNAYKSFNLCDKCERTLEQLNRQLDVCGDIKFSKILNMLSQMDKRLTALEKIMHIE